VTRGDIFRIRLPKASGDEQRGSRYVVIMQADELLGLSTAIVAPASLTAAPATFRPEVRIGGEPARVLVEQLRAVDAGRLAQRKGRLSAEEQRSVDAALELVLAL
jgi:mRNA interferase MazF